MIAYNEESAGVSLISNGYIRFPEKAGDGSTTVKPQTKRRVREVLVRYITPVTGTAFKPIHSQHLVLGTAFKPVDNKALLTGSAYKPIHQQNPVTGKAKLSDALILELLIDD